MIRGTTAPFKIKLPCSIEDIEWLTMKFWQDGNNGTPIAPLPITKKLSNCYISNIYVCELSSNIVLNQQCCFDIDGVTYGFTAPQNIDVGSLLKYNTQTQSLTLNDLIITSSEIDNGSGMTKLTFVNEINYSKELYVSLTAEETMRFSDKYKAKMQLRGKRISTGKVFGCRTRLVDVYPISDDLLEDDLIVTEDNSGWIVLDGKKVSDE